jgi:malate synthase-like protein
MEDAATAEISRAQLWFWLHHPSQLGDGRPVTHELYRQIRHEELGKLSGAIEAVHLNAARTLLDELVLKDEFAEFLTLLAYERLVGSRGKANSGRFEGRSFPGWHHHISVVLCCYAFIVSQRVRRFPRRSDGKLPTVRSPSRPERHFADSFITLRLVIARAIVRWLPRCPLCHRACDERDHGPTGHD